MNTCWQGLPDEMVDIIMSYGDPNIVYLYKNVIHQLTINMNEYNYYRPNERKSFNRWFLFYSYYKY